MASEDVNNVEIFRKLVSKLTPSAASNRECVKWLNAYTDDHAKPVKTLIDVMSRSSLNARARQIYLIEFSAGFVGDLTAPKRFIDEVLRNLRRIVDAVVPLHLSPASLINCLPAKALVDRLYKGHLIDKDQWTKLTALISSKAKSLKSTKNSHEHKINKDEILRRIEDDRERGKKYKEREATLVIGSRDEFEMFWKRLND